MKSSALPVVAALLLLAGDGVAARQAGAPLIYRCHQAGVEVFSDRPCAPQAQRADLPALQAVPAERDPAGMARQWDRQQAAQTAHRDRQDRAWLAAHAARRAREDRVRRGLVEGRAVVGMTPEQVRRALGDPQRVQRGSGGAERWLYQSGRRHRSTIDFRAGRVRSIRGAADGN